MGRPPKHLTPDDKREARARANKKYDASNQRKKQRLKTVQQRAPRVKEEVDFVKIYFSTGIWGVQYGSTLRPPKMELLNFKLPFDFSGCFPIKTLCLSDFFVANFIREPGWESRTPARWKDPRAYRFEDLDRLLANASATDVENAISGHIVRDALDSFRSRTVALDLLQPGTFLTSLKQAIHRAEWATSEFDTVSEWLNSIQHSDQPASQSKRYTLARQIQLWRVWELCFLRSEIHERQQRARRVFAKSITDGTSSWAKNIQTCRKSASLRTRIMSLLTGKIISNENCADFGKNLCNRSCTQKRESNSDDSDDSDDSDEDSNDEEDGPSNDH